MESSCKAVGDIAWSVASMCAAVRAGIRLAILPLGRSEILHKSSTPSPGSFCVKNHITDEQNGQRAGRRRKEQTVHFTMRYLVSTVQESASQTNHCAETPAVWVSPGVFLWTFSCFCFIYVMIYEDSLRIVLSLVTGLIHNPNQSIYLFVILLNASTLSLISKSLLCSFRCFLASGAHFGHIFIFMGHTFCASFPSISTPYLFPYSTEGLFSPPPPATSAIIYLVT